MHATRYASRRKLGIDSFLFFFLLFFFLFLRLAESIKGLVGCITRCFSPDSLKLTSTSRRGKRADLCVFNGEKEEPFPDLLSPSFFFLLLPFFSSFFSLSLSHTHRHSLLSNTHSRPSRQFPLFVASFFSPSRRANLISLSAEASWFS